MLISERDSTIKLNSEGIFSSDVYAKGKARQVQASGTRRGCNFSKNKRPGHPRGDVTHNLICTSTTKRYHPLSFFPLSFPLSLSLSSLLLSSLLPSTLYTPSQISSTLYHVVPPTEEPASTSFIPMRYFHG